MAGENASQKFFDALNQSYDAWIDALRTGNERSHRFSQVVLDEARRGQRDAIDLGKKWMEAPLDVVSFYSSAIETFTRSQGRMLDVTRQLFGDVAESQKDARQVAQRVMDANRSAGEAVGEVARGAFTRAADAARSVVQRGADAVTAAGSPAAAGDGNNRPQRSPSRATAQAPMTGSGQLGGERPAAESMTEPPSMTPSQEPPAAYQPEAGSGEAPPFPTN
jgi:hypothetical protein